jgi:hypothetical protein
MGLSDEEVDRIRAAAAVHDVGKLHVPREVLNKPGPLTDEEFEQVKRHAAEGAALVACLGDAELAAIVRHHHERVDGTGYPDGLSADAIPLGARIVAVADTFDAIIATRPYRPAAPHKRAIDALMDGSGTQLDPDVVNAFLSRYSSNSGLLAVWAALAGLAQGAMGWLRPRRGTRRPGSPAQGTATVATVAAVAAAAIAAPVSLTHHRRQPPPPVASAPVAVTPAATVTRAAARRPVHPKARSTSATCQAYNPQLCSTLGGGSLGGGAATGASASGGSLPGTLPFTGVNAGLLALMGILLVALGVVVRRVAPGAVRRP